jgi:hypothetical protein
MLLLGAEARNLKSKRHDMKSLEILVNRFLMKLLKTNNMTFVYTRMFRLFEFKWPSYLLVSHYSKFLGNIRKVNGKAYSVNLRQKSVKLSSIFFLSSNSYQHFLVSVDFYT